MKIALRRMLSTLGVVSIVLMSICVYAAEDDLLNFIPAIVKAQSSVNPIGTWTGTGVAASHAWDGSGDQRCDGLDITVTVSASATNGVYLVTYSIPSFCMGTWGFTNIPGILVGNRLVFNYAGFADIGSPGSTARMAMDLRAELVVSNNSASFVIQNNGSAFSPEKAIAWVMGGTLTKQ
ncbi:hypothetical protein [Desulfovibrio sp. DV]|uniref:hypothetical protein n=1 Tax=Desulfovibrio sp. DV TaxID=1844708 RepID=UPI0011153FD4|nr:hypothetical protein [Desulfovibrio sp. DV]